MEREIERKTETNVCGKWRCPLVTQVKLSHIVYKTMSIAVGLDKYPLKRIDVMFVKKACTRNYLSN